MLALGYSNGSTLIFDVNNGKRIHNIGSESPGVEAVSCMGWIDNHSYLLSNSQHLSLSRRQPSSLHGAD